MVGGDTTSSTGGLFISITAIGEVAEEDVTYRNTAKESDLLVVSGDLGAAYLGLLLLEREKQVFSADPNMQPEFEGYDYILERQLKPEVRFDVIRMLKDLKIKPTSMIDISDGLASEIFHICNQSNVGCKLFEDKLPIDQSAYNLSREFTIDPTTCMLNGGEDYELLFTIKQKDFEKIKGNPLLTVIGHITNKNEGMNLITKSGTVAPLKAQGWDGLKNAE